MEKSYLPKATEGEFCDGIHLCTVRKTDEGISKVGFKDLAGNISEIMLEKVINEETYNGKEIVRVYSSGHVFIDDTKKEVFLVTTDKHGKVQHQFTGGSPLEDENKEVIIQENGVLKFDLEKVRNNARMRTKNRTGVTIIEEYNEKLLVDWALMENEENGKIYYKLVCLMHFVVKKYEGFLSATGNENTIDSNWYTIDDLPDTKGIAPNAYIVSKKALDFIG